MPAPLQHRRLIAHLFAFLIAVILTLLPSVMWPDLVFPIDNWENWYWKGQPHSRPHFTLAQPPTLLRVEMSTYRALATPPGYLRRTFTGFPTAYSSFWIAPYQETAGVPPFAMTLEHAAWALPFWFVALAAICETTAAIGRAFRRRSKAG